MQDSTRTIGAADSDSEQPGMRKGELSTADSRGVRWPTGATILAFKLPFRPGRHGLRMAAAGLAPPASARGAAGRGRRSASAGGRLRRSRTPRSDGGCPGLGQIRLWAPNQVRAA